MKSDTQPDMLGIVGGMGPLASAEFVKTIYEYNLSEREQDAPLVLLYSDPRFPDRTDSFLAGESEFLLERLTAALEYLAQGGASSFVICCMTIHYLLPRLPLALRARVLSLLDVIFAALEGQRKRHLLICSNGTRKLELFQSHSLWEHCAPFIVLPDNEDQDRIHRELIYPIKKNPDLRELMPLLETLLRRYEVDSFIAGCSEVHLLAKRFVFNGGGEERAYGAIDPLAIIARDWPKRMSESQRR